MKDCKYKHNAKKYANGQCSECSKLATARSREKNLNASRERDKVKAKKRREAKADHINSLRRESYKNLTPEQKKIRLSNSMHRKMLKRRAIPPWSDRKAVRQVYVNCPQGHQVDHIIPLTSDIVCGLHVHNNLQYLTPIENLRKLNRYNPEWEISS